VSLPRFHVPRLHAGAAFELPDPVAHHALHVLRLEAGDHVRLFDGAGAEFEARLESVTRGAVTARLLDAVPSRPESPLRVTLALSPLKGDLMDLVIQKATELGVARILPVVTQRTDAVARPSLEGARHDRWSRVASGAAEQCGRAVVPEIIAACTLDALLREAFDGPKVFFSEREAQPSLRTLQPAKSCLVLIGPAGGWEDDEAAGILSAGYQPVGLGPRTLRAETAAIAALVAVQVLWGDLA
jgi:16S rRNA (uracil1498-N3)-methyltransferase